MGADSIELHPKWEQWNEAAKGTFWDELGCTIDTVNERQVIVSLEIQPRHLNLIGIMHGGVYATMIDSAMGLLAMIVKPDANVVTTNLNINYVAKAEKGIITVIAELIHVSRKSITAQATARMDQGELCAFGTGTFRVI